MKIIYEILDGVAIVLTACVGVALLILLSFGASTAVIYYILKLSHHFWEAIPSLSWWHSLAASLLWWLVGLVIRGFVIN